MSEEIIDIPASSGKKQEGNDLIKTLGIISIVGSSLWILLLLIGGLYLMAVGGAFLSAFPIADPMGAIIFIGIILLFMIFLNVAGIIGATNMMKGKKSGYVWYMIGTVIWAVLLLFNYSEVINLISALASIGFIVGFSTQLKTLN